ncbi:hypothetical protein CAEBREN_30214 [Caenorhabditis brenneri]|uniref:Uncharacterized protein n=1 Tax=Caenorhabditis brenneri TaxID=135651 RepID=G0MGM0_CAEBE|nr:hypothetical protein CAEBREN_30214 [Caenorhabditis brenneri]
MSMLASAAVANIICNLFLQLPADRCTDMLGFKKPVLSNDQMNTPEYQHASFAAKVSLAFILVRSMFLEYPGVCGLWLGLTIGMLPLFFIDDNMDSRASNNREFLSGTKSEWFVMENEENRRTNADEYCELFNGE